MYYRLNDDYTLRAWKYVNHGLYHRYNGIEPGDGMYIAPEDRVAVW